MPFKRARVLRAPQTDYEEDPPEIVSMPFKRARVLQVNPKEKIAKMATNVSMPFKRARVLQGEKKMPNLVKLNLFQCPLSGQGYCRKSICTSSTPPQELFQCPLSGQGYCGHFGAYPEWMRC